MIAVISLAPSSEVIMAPKEWSNEVTITAGELRHILATNAKAIERLSWKSQDFEECLEGYMPMFKALCRHSIKFNRTMLRRGCANAHLGLTPNEVDTFSEKVVAVIKYVKRRLRDRGSGKFLPGCVIAIEKIWKQHHQCSKEKGKEKRKSGGSKEARLDRSLLDPKAAGGIRAVFGLGSKTADASIPIDLLSSDSDLEELSVGAAATSSGSS